MVNRVVCIVCPLPPPVNGFSEINHRMLVQLQVVSPVKVFDVAPRGGDGICLNYLRSLWERLFVRAVVVCFTSRYQVDCASSSMRVLQV